MTEERTKSKDKKPNKRKKAQISERQSIHFELWLNGLSYREISEHRKAKAERDGLPVRGMSHEQVRQDVEAVLAIKSEELEALAQHHKVGIVEGLRDIISTYAPLSKRKITDETPAAIVKAKTEAGKLHLAALDKLAEILGIKAALRHEHTGKDGKPIQVVQATLADWRKDVEARRTKAEQTTQMFEEA